LDADNLKDLTNKLVRNRNDYIWMMSINPLVARCVACDTDRLFFGKPYFTINFNFRYNAALAQGPLTTVKQELNSSQVAWIGACAPV